jgi:tRNA (cmo5U34)-methyltransferase
MADFAERFTDPALVARYAEGPPRFMPGYADVQTMTGVLLAERAGPEAEILVIGAGGGLEMKRLAAIQPGWSLTGVDPAPAMLALARTVLGEEGARVRLIEGVIDDAPPGPFGGACALLTLHFLGQAERARTLAEIRRRLMPGAAFVAAHLSIPQEPAARARWLDRYAAFAAAQGAEPELIAQARAGMDDTVDLLDPATDEKLLREAGFADIAPFYAGFTWRGWVGYA